MTISNITVANRAVGERRQAALAGPRKALAGRATVTVPHGPTLVGQLVDISLFGVSVVLSAPIAKATVCTIECQATFGGLSGPLKVRAAAMYSLLLTGSGYRVGFQFEPLDAAASEVLKKALA